MPGESFQLPAQVKAALERGQTLEAIKLLRQATGLGLSEARHLVQAALQGPAASAGSPPPPSTMGTFGSAPGVREALARGDKITAIRLHREHAGVGLKEAKDAVEALARGIPAASDGLAPGEVPRNSTASVLGWLVAAVVVGALLVAWVVQRGGAA